MSRGSHRFLAALVSGVFAGCSEEPPQAIAPSVNPDNIVITLDRNGKMYWNGKLIESEQDVLALLAARSGSADSDPSSNIVMLDVLGDGSFVWNGERVPDAETLDRYWQMAAAQEPKPEIHLRRNPDAKEDTVRRALEGAEKSGMKNLGFLGNPTP